MCGEQIEQLARLRCQAAVDEQESIGRFERDHIGAGARNRDEPRAEILSLSSELGAAPSAQRGAAAAQSALEIEAKAWRRLSKKLLLPDHPKG